MATRGRPRKQKEDGKEVDDDLETEETSSSSEVAAPGLKEGKQPKYQPQAEE